MKKNDTRQLLIQTFTWKFDPNLKDNLNQSIQIVGDSLFVTGRIQYADKLNGNERYYPKHVLQKAINEIMPIVQARLFYCETDHPDSDIVSLRRVSALIEKIFWKGDQVFGTLRILSNRMGQDIKNIIMKDKGSISISSRGLGSLKRTEKGDQVQDDYQLTSWDLVVIPSTTNATFYAQKAKTMKEGIDSKVQSLIKTKKVKNEYVEQINNIFEKYNKNGQ